MRKQTARKGYRRFVVICVLLTVCVLSLTAFLYLPKADRVASVGPYEITAAELSFHMKRLQSQVQNEFQTQYGITLGKDDWEKEFAGRKPLRELQEKALAEIIRDKTIFILAQEAHLIDYVDFSDFLKAMEQENRNRKEAAASGEVVYGLMNFSAEPYYSHVLSSLRTALKTALSENESDPLYIERGEVEAYFDANKMDWAVKGTSYKLTRLTIPAAQENRTAVQAEVQRLLSHKADLTEIRSTFSDAQADEEVLAEESVSYQNTFDYELLLKLKDMAAGEMTAPMETRQGLTVYRLDEIVFDEQKALNGYRYQMTQQLLDERLNEYLAGYRKSLEIEVYEEKLSSVTTTGS
ncbi:peptidyl-prolyl cis-trans isomerase [Paenibacillus sp. P96]|uniref:Peptidyl-prolyl cis-trans isomerase n=1 Tax=Paenibacillus zeirhizosphaerae TaxID=2987519 RepID=A0ABT9FUL0_9BACL|nr:peptidylprolyl isomerase [Paenibacillus sp. P96]MDP4098142.1 peptidyl-prolyl cis-trans isomerase [Paenibacillus sp. P96]